MKPQDLNYSSDSLDHSETMPMRPGARIRTRKRPDYCRQRTPVRLGIKRRSKKRRTVKF